MTTKDTSATKTAPIPDETYNNAAKYQKLPLLSKNLWTAFITVFISGIVIGAVSIQLFMDRKIKRYFLPEHIKTRILSRITNELNLSPAQRKEADQIITKMTNQIGEIRRSQTPEIQAIIRSSFSDITKLLNKEQKKKFIHMQEKIRSCQGRSRGMSRGLRQPPCNIGRSPHCSIKRDVPHQQNKPENQTR